MNLIEEAAKRLQHLEHAGIEVARQRSIERQASSAVAHPRRPPVSALCTLDFGQLQRNGILTPAVQDSKMLQELRVIKRPLIQYALGKSGTRVPNGNLVMVTSAMAGEGKTFVAVNLAMSLAREVDCTVLLVDADVVSPSVPGVLGIEPAKGLMDLLTGSAAAFSDVHLRTNVERLTLLLAGTPHAGAAEHLASAAMARLLAEIAGRYSDRIVVFDSPPLLATTESRVLATYMGQVVLVVEAERTTHGIVESALSTVASCPSVVTVLNKARESDVLSSYGS